MLLPGSVHDFSSGLMIWGVMSNVAFTLMTGRALITHTDTTRQSSREAEERQNVSISILPPAGQTGGGREVAASIKVCRRAAAL